MTPSNQGTAENHIIFRAYPGDSPVIDASGRTVGVYANGVDYIEFVGLTIRDANRHGFHIEGGCDYLWLTDCVVYNCGYNGIRVGDSTTSHIYIDNCTVYQNGQVSTTAGHGILFNYGGDNSEITNCTIYENGVTPGRWHSGLELCGVDNCTVEYNTIYGNNLHGIDVCDDSHGNVVRYNEVYNNARVGIALDNGAYSNTIHHNLIYSNGTMSGYGGGIYIWTGATDYPYDNAIYNNVIFDNSPTALTSGGIGFQNTGITGHIVKNNVLFNNSPYDYHIADDQNIDGGSDYNLIHGDIDYEGTDYDLAGYQAASGRDAHSIAGYPMFVNEDFAEFHLRPDSPCIDAGVDVGYDYTGTAPCMGRYEHSYQDDAVFTRDPNLQGLWLLEEASGTRYDETDNDNDLTDYNTIGQGTDEYKEGTACADFEASNSEYGEITDSVQQGLDITGDLTLSCWFRLESLGARVLVSKYQPVAGGRSYMLWVFNSGGGDYRLRCNLSYDGSTYVGAYGGTSLDTGKWYHGAVVYDGVDIRIYLNGALDSNGIYNPLTYSSGIYDSATAVRLGAYVSGWYHDGLLDEVAVFDRALSADEISALYYDGLRPSIAYSVAFSLTVSQGAAPAAAAQAAAAQTLAMIHSQKQISDELVKIGLVPAIAVQASSLAASVLPIDILPAAALAAGGQAVASLILAGGVGVNMGVVITPSKRTFVITAENRTREIIAENRTFVVPVYEEDGI